MKHITLNGNSFGRDLVLTDVNGCYKELIKLTQSIGFCDNDRLFLLGNSINKGLYSYEVIKFTGKPNVYPIIGSAELLMLVAMLDGAPKGSREILEQQWDVNGGTWRHEMTSGQLAEMHSAISEWPLTITLNAYKNIGMVHAESPFDDWNYFKEQEIDYNLLLRATNGRTILQGGRDGLVSGVDFVISGHTQLARPPVYVGKCAYINHGIVIGRKSKIYDVKEFDLPTL
jgi:hypothetical protein